VTILIIILRIIHILAGALWVGAAFFNILFLQPTIRATGADGQKVSQYMVRKTRMTTYVYAVATLNFLAGLILYIIITGFRPAFLMSGYGLTLTIGALAGIISWIMVVFLVRGIFSRMAAIGQMIQSQGGTPTPEQVGEMQSLAKRLGSLGNYNLVFMAIAVVGMSTARYIRF